MAKHYSTRDFFRQVPNPLLALYFARHGLFTNIDFAGMKEGKPEALLTAWEGLPDEQRQARDAELRDIFTLCNAKGFQAILDEAAWQFRRSPEALAPFVEKLSALESHHERAMVTYLNHPGFMRGAARFHHADSLSYWRKRKNLPRKPVAADAGSCTELAKLIGGFFHDKEGRGRNCVVEPYRRGDRDYFFCFPEDHSQTSAEWVNGDFERRPHNPAFEVIYVYAEMDGTLDLYFSGAKKTAELLQGMFATAILKLEELPPDPKDERVYDLAPLVQRDFGFVFSPGDGIAGVAVRKLRLSSRAKRGDRIVVEADTTEDAKAVYTLLDRIGPSLPLSLYNVTQAEIVVRFANDGDRPGKTATIRVSFPNSCSLKYDEQDLKLRAMLEASGIEPRAAA